MNRKKFLAVAAGTLYTAMGSPLWAQAAHRRPVTKHKLGKRPARLTARDFKLTDVAPSLPTPTTKRFGFGTMFKDWGMLANDKYGDCVFAGADHETMLWNKWAKTPVDFTPENALSDYSAVTGFQMGYPTTDQGTVVADAMSYRRKTGLVDINGNRHKIDAYVSIDPKDWDTMVKAVWTFGCVGMGFEFPESAYMQFESGLHWDVQSGDHIVGGHYVPVVGSTNYTQRVTCITWGKRQELTRAFYEAYNDETWVPLSLEAQKNGKGLHAIDEAKLHDLLASL